MRKIFSSIDIGSSFIKIVVCEQLKERLVVLASKSYPTLGVKDGLITNEEKLIESLKNAFSQINSSLGVKIDKVILSVPINGAKYEISEGSTSINSDDKIINSEDILNALQASIYNKIDNKMELVTIMPIKYIINDKNEVKNPKGLRADKLSIYSMIVTAPKRNIYEFISVLHDINIEVVDLLFNPIGDYYCFKEDKFDNEVIGVINIGSDKTELSIFNKGIISNSKLLNDGSSEITEEIAYVYNISKEKAEKLKNMFLVLDKSFANNSEIYETKDNSNIKIKINQYEISEIAESKYREILEKSKKEINRLTKKEISYIIITGGICNIPGFDSTAEDVLDNSAYIKPMNILGIRNYEFSSSYGMIKYFINKLAIRGREYTMFDEEKEYKLIENKKNNDKSIPLGKLFGYFFDNKEE